MWLKKIPRSCKYSEFGGGISLRLMQCSILCFFLKKNDNFTRWKYFWKYLWISCEFKTNILTHEGLPVLHRVSGVCLISWIASWSLSTYLVHWQPNYGIFILCCTLIFQGFFSFTLAGWFCALVVLKEKDDNHPTQ